MMDDLNTLADRVEAASGPDRALDAAIVFALFDVERIPGAASDGSQDGFVDHKRVLTMGWNFTASIDSALTLVPDGMRTCLVSEMEHDSKWQWRLGYKYGTARWGKGGIDGYAATAPLALCTAALRARAGGAT